MPVNGSKSAVLIAGPTASGKSALAMHLAAARGGIIVNADSMQVYGALRVLTARPDAAEETRVPHRLYGVVDPAERFSTGAWLRAVAALLDEAQHEHRPLIFVGGTGLYFDALLGGLSEIPEIPQALVERIGREVGALDERGRAHLIAEKDPETARRLQAPDPQRVTRALAVLEHTGRSLASFQGGAGAGLLNEYDVERWLLDPGRDIVRDRIRHRFESMLERGAEEEVRALLDRRLPENLPAMKAIGVRQIARWLAGEISKEEAIELSVIATQQYAKRQRTWFRNRFSGWRRLFAPPQG